MRKSTAGGGRVEVESVGLGVNGGMNGGMNGGGNMGMGMNGGGMDIAAAMKVGGTFYAVKKKIYEGLAVVAGA